MVGNHVADLVARYGEGGEIAVALTDYIKARQHYDYGYHGKAGNPSTDFVPDYTWTASAFWGPSRTI